MTTKELFSMSAEALRGLPDAATMEVVVLPLPRGTEGEESAGVTAQVKEVERVRVEGDRLVLVAR